MIRHKLHESRAWLGRKIIADSIRGNQASCIEEQAAHHGSEPMSETRKVIIDGVEFEVEIEGEGTEWSATVEGKTFAIQIPDAAPVSKKKRSGGGKKKKSGTVSANIPGKVVTVEVNVGDEVAEGQVILILEAMKMQNEIQAPVTGTVVSVQCEEGQAIEANIPLVVIEPVAQPDEE
jgi:biotin carboxyl carrier protein